MALNLGLGLALTRNKGVPAFILLLIAFATGAV